MSEQFELVTVVIATYNSEKTLEKVLFSLRGQSYPKEKIEILIIDGGSTDKTIEIAQKYDCKIVDNPKTEPVNAKLIGASIATGKYLITLDHDEVLENKDSILIRERALRDNPDCKVAFCSGYKRPKDYPLLNQYLSEFGDPFSLYMYYFSKDHSFYEKALKRHGEVIFETEKYSKIELDNSKRDIIIELCCLATMIDLDYFRNVIKIHNNSSSLVHAFYKMMDDGERQIIISKNDPLVHYSIDSLAAYFPKLKWRICNNIFFAEKGENGFTGREKYQTVSKYKKYFFVFYSYFIPISLFHSIWMAITRRNAIYLLHSVLCVYVATEILFQYCLKLMGYNPKFKSYDGKKEIIR